MEMQMATYPTVTSPASPLEDVSGRPRGRRGSGCNHGPWQRREPEEPDFFVSETASDDGFMNVENLICQRGLSWSVNVKSPSRIPDRRCTPCSGRPSALGPATSSASGETVVRMARSKLSLSHMLSCTDASGWPNGLFVQPTAKYSSCANPIPSHPTLRCVICLKPRICLLGKLRRELDRGHWRKDGLRRWSSDHGRYHRSCSHTGPRRPTPEPATSRPRRRNAAVSVASEHAAPPGFQKPQEKKPTRPHCREDTARTPPVLPGRIPG
jgi:hypothetical protein